MMTNDQIHTDEDSIRVAAPVVDLDIPVCSEVMHALIDPADPDQAMLVNVPVLADGINFGDIVRLAPADELGVRRIVEVVVASGHVHMLVAVDEGEASALVEELDRMFPAYALRIEGASQTILSISIHPHLDADDVTAVIEAWLGASGEPEAWELPIAPACESEIGLVAWS